MVVKIMKPSRTMSGPLEYNDRKVSSGEAVMVSAVNLMEGCDARETFTRYEHMNIRSSDVSFHMAINPSETENMSDERLKEFVKEIMDGMGYGEQPYVIYRHTDIDRTHWHVLSVRTDSNGKKIRDHQEKRHCQEIIQGLSEKYGYTVGNGKKDRNRKLDIKGDWFNPKGGDVIAQIDAIFADCLKYRFTTFSQFALILEHHGIHMEERTGDKTTLAFQGLDKKGQPCTRQVSESMTSGSTYEAYSVRARECLKSMKVLSRERSRVSNIAGMAFNVSTSENHFRNILAKQGIDVHIVRDGSGKATGVTYIDHSTRCAFKASDIGPDVSAKMVRSCEESGKWLPDVHDIKGHSEPKKETRRRSSSASIVGSALSGLGKSAGQKVGRDDRDKEDDEENMGRGKGIGL